MNRKTCFRSVVTVLGLGTLTAGLALSGCVSKPAGAGAAATYVYLKGDLESTLEGNLDRAFRASNEAVKQLQFTKISESKDALLGIVVARNAADKKIEIRVDKAGENLTKVKIHAGLVGDEALSLAVLERIKANL
jgi:Protein of unknown function (DUF3568)